MAALIYREARPVFSLLIQSLLLPQCNRGPLTALSYLVSNLPSHLTLDATEVLRRYVVCVRSTSPSGAMVTIVPVRLLAETPAPCLWLVLSALQPSFNGI